jgi:hypothetical protein
MLTVTRLFLLTVVLNVIRYLVGGAIESVTVLPSMMRAMAESSGYFNTQFTTLDWATSFLYNFAMWFTAVVAVHVMWPRLGPGRWLPSLKWFAVMYASFASVTCVYMNHYSHRRDFYVSRLFDGAIVFAVVALSHALLYPFAMRGRRSGRSPTEPSLHGEKVDGTKLHA